MHYYAWYQSEPLLLHGVVRHKHESNAKKSARFLLGGYQEMRKACPPDSIARCEKALYDLWDECDARYIRVEFNPDGVLVLRKDQTVTDEERKLIMGR